MATVAEYREAYRIAKKELERHPGDAPWSCVECYHNRPCTKKIIYSAAVTHLKSLAFV